MDIDDWRRKVDRVDKKILRLLNQRAEYALKIGRIKTQAKRPIYDPEREEEILNLVAHKNNGPLKSEVVRGLFERIIQTCRQLQEELK